MPREGQTGADVRGLRLALGAYLLIFVAKLAVYFPSGVMVLLVEALHTLSYIFISGFLLVGVLYFRKRADQTHMSGYGRADS